MRSAGRTIEEGTAGREALWSAYVHGMGLQPSRLPPALRPISLSDAIAITPELTDEHAPTRSLRVLQQAVKAAGLSGPPGPHCARIARSPKQQRDVETKSVRHGLARKDIKVSRQSLARLVDCITSEPEPCIDPETKMTLGGPDNQPVLLTSHVVRRPIEELVELLDPRYWDRCGDLFALTRRVRAEGGFDYPVYEPDPVPPGHDWSGLLHERAVIPGQVADNILRVDFRVDLAKDSEGVGCPGDDIERCLEGDAPMQMRFSLFHALGYQMGGADLPGILLQDSGKMVAWRAGKDKTRICSRKEISYARLTTWGGTGTWDYGEALTYAAPATMCLWTEELHLVLGCCRKERRRP